MLPYPYSVVHKNAKLPLYSSFNQKKYTYCISPIHQKLQQPTKQIMLLKKSALNV